MAKQTRPSTSPVDESVTAVEASSGGQAPDVRTAITTAFRNDEAVRQVMRSQLKARRKEAVDVAERATTAFAKFSPVQRAVGTRDRVRHLAPGEDLDRAQQGVMTRGLEQLRQASSPGSLRLRLSDDLSDILKTTRPAAGTLIAKTPLDRLTEFVVRAGGRPGGRSDAALNTCRAEIEADRRLAQIAGSAPSVAPPAPPPAADDDTDKDRTASQFVKEQVALQMSRVTAPERTVRFEVPERSDQADRQTALETFELRDGPSDVTSIHDFSSLQIAFDHVWTELFDTDIKSLGEELYAEYVKLEKWTGADSGTDPTFSTVDELKAFLKRVAALGGNIQDSLPKFGAGVGGVGFGGSWHLGMGHAGVLGGLGRLFGTGASNTDAGATPGASPGASGDSSRLFALLETLERRLAETYAFDVFAADSVNFGILVTYRQTWEPQSYQVGDLVSTIPLAPKEMLRYTTRTVTKRSRARKEVEDNLETRRSDASDTGRVDAEIVEAAQNRSNFSLTAQGSIGGEGYKVEGSATKAGEQSKQSQQVKKEFRESVLKSAQEYKQQRRIEIDASETAETESGTFREIQNPNDELTVTYLFYELQRTYKISEKLHKVTPVILVANQVPAPNAINDAWLIEHDWILRRVILDDSFRPALDYLTTSFVGAETNIRILEGNAQTQKRVVDSINQQIQTQGQILTAQEKDVRDAVQGVASAKAGEGALNIVKGIFDPLGLTGKADTGAPEAAQEIVDYARQTRERAEREKARLLSQLEVALTALQAAIDKLSHAVREHYDNVAALDRLRLHVKENILHYMQAIWSHEPPDQRYFRLYDIDVPVIEPDLTGVSVEVHDADPELADSMQKRERQVTARLPLPTTSFRTVKLVEIAELDTVLGYKGNYMIFPLKENNYLTLFMMQEYLEVADEVLVRDPDEYGNHTLDELQRLAACLNAQDPDAFERHRTRLRDEMIARLSSPRGGSEIVVVPTSSLYIEALVGTHPLLEDFKLIHRALDVKKTQADTRHAELENIRLAARALKGEHDDPDIDRKIVIETDTGPVVIPPDGI